VARYGDACNLRLGAHPKLSGYTQRAYENYRDRLKRLTHKLSVLKKHCDREGRDYDEVEKSVLSPLESPGSMATKDVIDMRQELAGIGIQHVILNMPDDHEIDPIETIGREVVPQLTGI